MRLGEEPKGIIGSGTVVTPPLEGEHWDPDKAAAGKKTWRVDVDFDYLSGAPVITESELHQGALAAMNWTPERTGVTIVTASADALAQLWAARTGEGSASGPDEVMPDEQYVEGATRRVSVNA